MASKPLRQPFGGAFISDRTRSQRVKADDSLPGKSDICLRGIGLLVGPGVTGEKLIQFIAAAIEAFHRMIAAKLLNSARLSHFPSKNPGSRSSRSRRGKGRGGASKAAKKAFHLSALRLKKRRSANASPALVRALSKTNSLTER